MWDYADHDQGLWAPTSQWHPGLLDLLLRLRNFEAYDPRDHAYGLLGLYQTVSLRGKPTPAALAPDYTKSVDEVMRDTTRYVIEESGGLNCVEALYRRVSDAAARRPTWVPHWERRWDIAQDDLVFRRSPEYTADGGKGLQMLDAANGDANVLSVTGLLIDQAHGVSQTAKLEAFRTSETLMATIEACRETVASSRHGSCEQLADHILAHTLCAGTDCNYDYLHLSDTNRQWSMLTSFRRRSNAYSTLLNHEPAGNATTEDITLLEAQYLEAVRNAYNNRRFFVTKDGRPGLGPQLMESGDIVAILYGSRWPVVLRPLLETGHYEILGLAYVYGIMDGEAVREHESEGKNGFVFHIH